MSESFQEPLTLNRLKEDPSLGQGAGEKGEDIKVPENKVLPNTITLAGFVSIVSGAVLLALDTNNFEVQKDISGVLLVLIGAALDGVDGYVARSHPALGTESGTKFDPLCDKMVNIILQSLLGYFAIQSDVNTAILACLGGGIALSVKNDIQSTLPRYQGAGMQEKLKTIVSETFFAAFKPGDCVIGGGESTKATKWGKRKTIVNGVTSGTAITSFLLDAHLDLPYLNAEVITAGAAVGYFAAAGCKWLDKKEKGTLPKTV